MVRMRSPVQSRMLAQKRGRAESVAFLRVTWYNRSMHTTKRIKIVIFVPETHADAVRQALGDAGGGVIGKYHHVTFSTKGTGRFTPGEGARPAIGEIGVPEAVAEEKIESVVNRDRLPAVIKAVMDVHPYEEPAIDVYPIEEYDR
jgi:hypothetical protein